MAIFALFEQFSGKVCSYFWALSLSVSPNMMHFVGYAQFRFCVLKATKAYCNEEVRNYGKILFMQSIKMVGGGDASPTFPSPLDPPLTGTRVFFIRVVRLYHVISFLRMSTYRSISADYSQLAL